LDDENYELYEGEEILQGDLIENFPVVKPPNKLETHNLVILTQSCDIVNKKTSNILVAPYDEISSYPKDAKGYIVEVRKGRRFLQKYLPPCKLEGHSKEALIVNFDEIWTVLLDEITSHVSSNERIRMRSPLREFISQAYAISIMRVSTLEEIPITPRV